MASLAHHLYTMACNNAWANHRLISACSQLSQEEFVARRTSFFPSIKATLNHILTVDWYYIDALERAYRRFAEPRNRRVLRSGGTVRHRERARSSSTRPTGGWSSFAAA